MLNKIKAGARSGHYRLVYFDEAGFAASPPVQYGWSWGQMNFQGGKHDLVWIRN
ncbi:hypothetical protein HZS38_07590 [Xenorhabdus nematophila]|uniref:hypothetical protein n=1 Tax=Xenorhabdus nematophila TaxID=628 RepID=UPI001796C68A|nr:hypothetical protein [Xenorhabdus nematophila]MBA0019022.1 hypothetical protein [Xenorhabdus nematophila]